MPISKSLCLSLLACLVFHGHSVAQTLHITGTVVDSLSSQGIGEASVRIIELPGVTTKTKVDGTFSLDGPISIFHAVGKIDASGKMDLQSAWNAAGRHTEFAKLPNRTRIFTKVDIGDKDEPSMVFPKKDAAEVLSKRNATYTLQITANGYLTKNIVLLANDTAVGTIRLGQANEQVGVWTNVTPEEMAKDGSGFGAGSIAGDPLRPSDMYVGGSKSGLWKTTDYGKTWSKINGISPDITRGCIIAVAPTTPATLYISGFGRIFKSTNAGVTFDTLATGGFDPYSLTVDPYDPTHLLSGLHEAADVIESVNGGVTWRKVGSGTIGGGVSVYPFFIDMGNAAATRTTWIAIGQNGSSPGRTTNSGATWSMPAGLSGLEHPHGNAQIFQQGSNLWMGGAYDFRGTILRSTDYGMTWAKVTTDEKPEAVVWGTDKNVYSMYAWACSGCDVSANFAHAPLPGGNSWTYEATPNLKIGPNTVAVANNGIHNVFVGLMWAEGLWRYVEP
jgi:hypothetical protein